MLARSGQHLPAGVRHVAWSLGDPLPLEALDPTLPPAAQALIHLAHDWNDRRVDDNINLAAAQALRDSARRLGLGRIVFASSQSARADALNAYGKLKWRVEQLFDAPNEVSLRIGLIYGTRPAGQYALLCKLAMATSVLPMIGAQQQVQPIHCREVARGILLAADSDLRGAIGLAHPQPMAFAQFLDTLAWRLRGGRLRVIPLPLRLVLRLCEIANALPPLPKIDRERILGLAGTRATPTAEDLARLGLELMPFAQGMLNEPAARRALLAEARAVLRYVLRSEPGGALLRRYARAVQASSVPGAMRLSGLFVRMPRLLRAVEPLNQNSTLARRLNIALALAEASPEGFRALGRGSRFGRLAALLVDGLLEIAAFPLRLAATAVRR